MKASNFGGGVQNSPPQQWQPPPQASNFGRGVQNSPPQPWQPPPQRRPGSPSNAKTGLSRPHSPVAKPLQPAECDDWDPVQRFDPIGVGAPPRPRPQRRTEYAYSQPPDDRIIEIEESYTAPILGPPIEECYVQRPKSPQQQQLLTALEMTSGQLQMGGQDLSLPRQPASTGPSTASAALEAQQDPSPLCQPPQANAYAAAIPAAPDQIQPELTARQLRDLAQRGSLGNFMAQQDPSPPRQRTRPNPCAPAPTAAPQEQQPQLSARQLRDLAQRGSLGNYMAQQDPSPPRQRTRPNPCAPAPTSAPQEQQPQLTARQLRDLAQRGSLGNYMAQQDPSPPRQRTRPNPCAPAPTAAPQEQQPQLTARQLRDLAQRGSLGNYMAQQDSSPPRQRTRPNPCAPAPTAAPQEQQPQLTARQLRDLAQRGSLGNYMAQQDASPPRQRTRPNPCAPAPTAAPQDQQPQLTARQLRDLAQRGSLGNFMAQQDPSPPRRVAQKRSPVRQQHQMQQQQTGMTARQLKERAMGGSLGGGNWFGGGDPVCPTATHKVQQRQSRSPVRQPPQQQPQQSGMTASQLKARAMGGSLGGGGWFGGGEPVGPSVPVKRRHGRSPVTSPPHQQPQQTGMSSSQIKARAMGGSLGGGGWFGGGETAAPTKYCEPVAAAQPQSPVRPRSPPQELTFQPPDPPQLRNSPPSQPRELTARQKAALAMQGSMKNWTTDAPPEDEPPPPKRTPPQIEKLPTLGARRRAAAEKARQEAEAERAWEAARLQRMSEAQQRRVPSTQEGEGLMFPSQQVARPCTDAPVAAAAPTIQQQQCQPELTSRQKAAQAMKGSMRNWMTDEPPEDLPPPPPRPPPVMEKLPTLGAQRRAAAEKARLEAEAERAQEAARLQRMSEAQQLGVPSACTPQEAEGLMFPSQQVSHPCADAPPTNTAPVVEKLPTRGQLLLAKHRALRAQQEQEALQTQPPRVPSPVADPCTPAPVAATVPVVEKLPTRGQLLLAKHRALRAQQEQEALQAEPPRVPSPVADPCKPAAVAATVVEKLPTRGQMLLAKHRALRAQQEQDALHTQPRRVPSPVADPCKSAAVAATVPVQAESLTCSSALPSPRLQGQTAPYTGVPCTQLIDVDYNEGWRGIPSPPRFGAGDADILLFDEIYHNLIPEEISPPVAEEDPAWSKALQGISGADPYIGDDTFFGQISSEENAKLNNILIDGSIFGRDPFNLEKHYSVRTDLAQPLIPHFRPMDIDPFAALRVPDPDWQCQEDDDLIAVMGTPLPPPLPDCPIWEPGLLPIDDRYFVGKRKPKYSAAPIGPGRPMPPSRSEPPQAPYSRGFRPPRPPPMPERSWLEPQPSQLSLEDELNPYLMELVETFHYQSPTRTPHPRFPYRPPPQYPYGKNTDLWSPDESYQEPPGLWTPGGIVQRAPWDPDYVETSPPEARPPSPCRVQRPHDRSQFLKQFSQGTVMSKEEVMEKYGAKPYYRDHNALPRRGDPMFLDPYPRETSHNEGERWSETFAYVPPPPPEELGIAGPSYTKNLRRFFPDPNNPDECIDMDEEEEFLLSLVTPAAAQVGSELVDIRSPPLHMQQQQLDTISECEEEPVLTAPSPFVTTSPPIRAQGGYKLPSL